MSCQPPWVYPRCMAANQAEADPSRADPAAAGDPGPGAQGKTGERYGPLAIDRRRKGDGRALILYADSRPQPRESQPGDSRPGDSQPGDDDEAGPSTAGPPS
jgi:hypothetical protein